MVFLDPNNFDLYLLLQTLYLYFQVKFRQRVKPEKLADFKLRNEIAILNNHFNRLTISFVIEKILPALDC
jgi:hypothetical protein